ncbi:hypothetical protein N7522_006323 [Penicillium canescens]|uniref:uncharacterized protein n=1 Tax=Penicillium canescens TaxID=5083 RepID=UPI0026E0FD56|nr:uncharacterized protein N7446_010765 [Penicillium canescens]KAJ6003631.1 hypothetical protein N7522_006323 [Penicillium canescens]KAJ6050656.1 hypothetical protein N7446_010765 [Penicillium canescens]
MTGPTLHSNEYEPSGVWSSSHGSYPAIKSSTPKDPSRYANLGSHWNGSSQKTPKSRIGKRPISYRKPAKPYTRPTHPVLETQQESSLVQDEISSFEKRFSALEKRLSVLENDWTKRWAQLQNSTSILGKQQDTISDLRQKSHHTLILLSTKQSELLHPDGLDFYPTDEKPQPQALVSPGLEDQGSINPELLSNAFDSEMFAEESAGAAFGNLIM